jgi:hypothetical protein
MSTFISIAYSILCGLMCIGLIYKLYKSDDVYEQITCGIALVPFLLRTFQIR